MSWEEGDFWGNGVAGRRQPNLPKIASLKKNAAVNIELYLGKLFMRFKSIGFFRWG
jgi:hypothetical protein